MPEPMEADDRGSLHAWFRRSFEMDAPTPAELATLRGIREGRLVVVPVEATDAMITASGVQEIITDIKAGTEGDLTQALRLLFSDMLAAAQKGG